MKKSSLKSVHQFLNDLLITQCSIFSHKQYFHQCFYVIECKLYKSKHLKCKKKPPENVFNQFVDYESNEFVNLARILHGPYIMSSLPIIPKTFSLPMVTNKLVLPISTKIFNFNKFVNSLHQDALLPNPDILPCQHPNSTFVFKYHNYIITGDLPTINNSSLRNNFCKDQNSVRKQSVDLNRATSYILSGLEDCANNTCSKHDIHKSMFPEWANKVKE